MVIIKQCMMLSLIINKMINFLRNNIYKIVTILLLIICFILLSGNVVGDKDIDGGFSAFDIIFGYTDTLYDLHLLKFSFIPFVGFALLMVACLLILFSLLNPTLNINKVIGVLLITSSIILFLMPEFIVVEKEYEAIKEHLIQKPTLYISCLFEIVSGIVIILEKNKLKLK